jgi:hypothetical protein
MEVEDEYGFITRTVFNYVCHGITEFHALTMMMKIEKYYNFLFQKNQFLKGQLVIPSWDRLLEMMKHYFNTGNDYEYERLVNQFLISINVNEKCINEEITIGFIDSSIMAYCEGIKNLEETIDICLEIASSYKIEKGA